MAGKFVNGRGMQDSVLTEARMNAARRRQGLERHPLHGYFCQCPSPACGAMYFIDTNRTILTPEEAEQALRDHSKKQNEERRQAKGGEACDHKPK